MKKFYMFIFVFVISLFIPKIVYGQQLVTTKSAIGVALYEQIRNEGYELTVPFENNAVFDHVMEPLVNAVMSTYEGVADTFFYVGERLYYDVSKVTQWVKSLFGSGDNGSFVPSSGGYPSFYTQSLYNANVAGYRSSWGSQFLPSDFGPLYNYPLVYLNGRYILPSIYAKTNDFIGLTTFSFVPSLSFGSDGSFTFSVSRFSFIADGNVYDQWNYTRMVFPQFTYPLNYNNVVSYTNLSLVYTDEGVTVEQAINKFITYLNTIFINAPWQFTFNGVTYRSSEPTRFFINKTSEPNPNLQPYMPVNYNYVINNWGSSDTIYNDTINNNGGSGSVDLDPILEAIQNVDESVIQGTDAIIEAINNLFFDKDIDINIPYDIDINSSITGLTSLPGIFENVSSGDLSFIDDDSESKEVFSGIFNGLPIEITTLFITVFILLVVVGVINRLLG